MKPSMDWLEYQRLEQIVPDPPLNQFIRLAWLRLKNIWGALFQYLVKPAELKVWQTQDRAGNIWWSAYDPATGRLIEYVSEDQIRVWLERRYQ